MYLRCEYFHLTCVILWVQYCVCMRFYVLAAVCRSRSRARALTLLNVRTSSVVSVDWQGGVASTLLAPASLPETDGAQTCGRGAVKYAPLPILSKTWC